MTDQNNNLAELRTKLVESKLIEFAKFDDELLLRFLSASDQNLTIASNLITEYFLARRKHTDIFSPTRFFLERFKTQLYYLLPKVENCPITDWDPSENSVHTALGHIVPYFQLLSFDEQSRSEGITIIVDMRGITFGHLKYLKPAEIKFGVMIFERIMPIKYNQIEILFENKLVRTIYSIIKPFLSDHIKKAIRFWGKELENDFFDLYPRSRLPETIGGEWVLNKFSETEINEMDRELNRHWAKYSV